MSVQTLKKNYENTRPDWAVLVESELGKIEMKLKMIIASDISSASDLSMYLLSAGGKRIRPALVTLCALACGKCDEDRFIDMASASELVHMASLVHDDVVDETHERRGVDTANHKWGNKISVLGGDYLLSKALQLFSMDGDPRIIRVFANIAVQMTESEILQAQAEGDFSLWKRNYWRIIRGKTAEFMGACCECGAIIGGADDKTLGALTKYGLWLGLAFQIADDLLDISGDPDITGKETGTDIINGKYTLPFLIALQGDNNDARELRKCLNDGVLSREDVRKAAGLVVSCGGVELAHKAALGCTKKARKYLSGIAPSCYINALHSLASFVIEREA